MAAAGYPELPATAVETCKECGIAAVSPAGARLLAPGRRRKHYSDLVRISGRGQSRHDVYSAVYEGRKCVQVVLKEFDLRVGGANMASATAALRTVQREVEHLSRLQHPCLIAPELFFVEPCAAGGAVEGVSATAGSAEGGMVVNVQFPWYPMDMERWLATEEATAESGAAARVIALDVLRGLEHVHRHGVVHCDVKPANVLVTERSPGPGGLRRGVLSDFDLSLDQAGRLHHSVASMSRAGTSAAGGRGTPGALSMAPEVTAGRTPTEKSDVYSLGGILLRIVCQPEADRWAAAPDALRWSRDGTPLLRLGKGACEDMQLGLVEAMLRKEPSARPTCAEALQDAFFSAGVVEQMERVYVLEDGLNRRAEHIALEARLTAEEAERERKELRDMEKKFLLEKEEKETELAAKLAAIEQERKSLASHAATERQRLADDDRRIREKQEENRRIDQEIAIKVQRVTQLKQQIEVDRQQAAAERQKLSVDAKKIEEKMSQISKVDAELESKRRDLQQERDVLVAESQKAATSAHRFALDRIIADTALQTKQRNLEERLAQLDIAERKSNMDREDAARQAREIKRKQMQALQLDCELETKRQNIERDSLALAQTEYRVKTALQRLDKENRSLELKRLELADEERRAKDVNRRLEAEVRAMHAELDKNRMQLKQEEERIKGFKECEEQRAMLARLALDSQRNEMLTRARQLQEQEERARPRIPPYWLMRNSCGYQLENDAGIILPLQQRIRLTAQTRSLANARVTKVLRIENRQLWSLYLARQAFLQDTMRKVAGGVIAPPSHGWLLSKTQQPQLAMVGNSMAADELLLFHGTSESIALTIAEHGFDERVANDGGLYGAGIYFADRSCKSDQYASRYRTQNGERVMLLCRVVMGWPHLITGGNKGQRRPPLNPATPGKPFDSIFAETGVALNGQQRHNEFVVFHNNQAYAEFLVYYVASES